MDNFVDQIISTIVYASTELLTSLGGLFTNVVAILYDGTVLTDLGIILVMTAGFALAYAGIRFVFSFVSKLLGATRGGAR